MDQMHDLSEIWWSYEPDVFQTPRFTLAGDAVVLQPTNQRKPFRFYPLDGSDVRVVPEFESKYAIRRFFVAMDTGYVNDSVAGNHPPQRKDRISKVFYDWSDPNAPVGSPVWSKTPYLDEDRGRMKLSDDGQYLALHAYNMHVLHTDDGRVVFAYPTEEALSLRPNLPPHTSTVDLYAAYA